MNRIAIFASGAGSNAAKIIDHFKNHPKIHVGLVLASKANAGVINVAAEAGIASLLLEKDLFFNSSHYIDLLKEANIDFVVLAGFLWKVPSNLVQAFPGRIINIHPALLPKYGGKGMYGRFVHQAVVDAGEKETGITIHYVDEQYDHGEVIFQAQVPVEPGDTAETVAAKVHDLEHAHFPGVIEEVINLRNSR